MHRWLHPSLIVAAAVWLAPWPGALAQQCTGEQILQLLDRGFSRAEVLRLCGPQALPPAAAGAAPQRPVAAQGFAGTWRGRRTADDAPLRMIIYPSGKYLSQIQRPDGRLLKIWGTLRLVPLGPQRAVLHFTMERWEPQDINVSYREGTISTIVSLPDPDTIKSNLFYLERADGGGAATPEG